MPARKMTPRQLEARLRKHALSFPESYEEFPWGERAIKVKRKVFVFMYAGPEKMHITVKLPESREFAVMFPFAAPSNYGLGKSGWVTSRLGADATAPLSLLKAWIDESFRAVAPKAVLAQLDGRATRQRAPTGRRTKRRATQPS